MNEIEVGNQKYRIGRLNAIQQLHIARRILPVFAGIGKTPSLASNADGDTLSQALIPIAEALQSMKDEDVEYIIYTALAAVTRQNSGGWVPVLARGTRSLMFEDIQLPELVKLTGSVIEENLSGFLTSALPPDSNSPAQ